MEERLTNWDDLSKTGTEGLEKFLREVPFFRYLDIRVEKIEPGRVVMTHEPRGELLNIYGSLHGGIISSLADIAMGTAIWTMVGPRDKMVTLEFKINYIAPVGEDTGTVTAEGKVIHAGKSTAVVEGSIRRGDGSLAARAQGTFFIRPEAG